MTEYGYGDPVKNLCQFNNSVLCDKEMPEILGIADRAIQQGDANEMAHCGAALLKKFEEGNNTAFYPVIVIVEQLAMAKTHHAIAHSLAYHLANHADDSRERNRRDYFSSFEEKNPKVTAASGLITYLFCGTRCLDTLRKSNAVYMGEKITEWRSMTNPSCDQRAAVKFLLRHMHKHPEHPKPTKSPTHPQCWGIGLTCG